MSHATTVEESDAILEAVLAASQILVGVAVRSLESDPSGVTIVQFRALAALHASGPGKVGSLADQLGVNASTAVRTIDRLLAAGLVTRAENPNNRREKLVGLSADGRRVFSRVTARRRRLAARIVGRMPEGQRGQLVSALRGFVDAADESAVRPA